MKLNFRRGF